MRSLIQIAPEAAHEVLYVLGMMHVAVVGSKDMEGAIALVIEGDVVPDCHLCECTIGVVTAGNTAQITGTFRPIE